LTSLQDFLACHDIKLEYNEAKVLELSREGDSYIMDKIHNWGFSVMISFMTSMPVTYI
jgi:hypothetical protein